MGFEPGAIAGLPLSVVQTPLWGQARGPPALPWGGVLALAFPRCSVRCRRGPGDWWPLYPVLRL